MLGQHQACGVNRYSGRRRLKTCRFGWLRPLSRSFKEARPAIFRQFAHQCTLQPRKSVVHLETNLSTLNICIYNPCWRDDLKPGPKPVRIYENCHVLHSAVQTAARGLEIWRKESENEPESALLGTARPKRLAMCEVPYCSGLQFAQCVSPPARQLHPSSAEKSVLKGLRTQALKPNPLKPHATPSLPCCGR